MLTVGYDLLDQKKSLIQFIIVSKCFKKNKEIT